MGPSRRTGFGAVAGFLVSFLVVHGLLPEGHPATTTVARQVTQPVAEERTAADLVAVTGRPEPVAATGPEQVAAAADTVGREPSAPDPTRRARGVAVHGQITDEDGTPIDGVYVATVAPNGDRAAVSTDALGRFSLGPLPAGTRTITASLRGRHDLAVDVMLPADAVVIRQDFVMRPQQVVRVRIATATGQPAVHALVASGYGAHTIRLVPVATREDPGDTFEGVTGSLNNPFGIGRFREPGLLDPPTRFDDEYGTVTISEDGPAWLSLIAAHQVLGKQKVSPDQEVVSFTLDPDDITALLAGVRATIVDAETGAALAARAWLASGPFAYAGKGTETDAATGGLVIDGALPGQKWLIIQAEGRATVTRPIRVERGEILELGTVVMHHPVSIEGRVVDADGKPYVARIRWGTLDDASGSVTWFKQTSTRSAATGAFTVRNLEPGVYVVQVRGLAFESSRRGGVTMASLPARADARTNDATDVTITLLKTSRITLVSGKTHDPWPYAIVVDAAGRHTRRTWLGRYTPETAVDLPQGRYTLEVHDGDGPPRKQELIVDDQPQRIEIKLDAD